MVVSILGVGEDHPRSRGVYVMADGPADNEWGSSPLARGLRRRRRGQDPDGWIIPARAGFTSPGPDAGAQEPGSSPLARGLPRRRRREARRLGIIPARAGFTSARRASRAAMRDHPRSRGVYESALLAFSSTRGSSPLARGLLRTISEPETLTRIIPARAGFTAMTLLGIMNVKDHPRSRGVYGSPSRPILVADGSSPLARGLLQSSVRPTVSRRIIPARAGFTCVPQGSGGRARDHPRSRGVYPRRPRATTRTPGSSPLARGLLHLGGGRGRERRIIPARAGFTIMFIVAL